MFVSKPEFDPETGIQVYRVVTEDREFTVAAAKPENLRLVRLDNGHLGRVFWDGLTDPFIEDITDTPLGDEIERLGVVERHEGDGDHGDHLPPLQGPPRVPIHIHGRRS